jgi:hypothetical protein
MIKMPVFINRFDNQLWVFFFFGGILQLDGIVDSTQERRGVLSPLLGLHILRLGSAMNTIKWQVATLRPPTPRGTRFYVHPITTVPKTKPQKAFPVRRFQYAVTVHLR